VIKDAREIKETKVAQMMGIGIVIRKNIKKVAKDKLPMTIDLKGILGSISLQEAIRTIIIAISIIIQTTGITITERAEKIERDEITEVTATITTIEIWEATTTIREAMKVR
jgi:hypothetical protein